MLETKDYWTIGISSAAALISVCAMLISNASYRLTKARDKREIERELPVAAIDMPICEARGPWLVQLRMENRGRDPVTFLEVGLPMTGFVNFVLGGECQKIEGGVDAKRSRDKRPIMKVVLNETLKPGDSVVRTIAIQNYDQKQIPFRAPAEFVVLAKTHDRANTVHRLEVFRIASAEKDMATP